ncbi:MAG: GTP cyclohydrolase I FolE [Actinomycetota bacterium]|nr:GTP cyclohydrolase I FolE [Actinomycetota bacterium]
MEGGGGYEVDRARLEKAVREILEAVGEDPDRDGLLGTPQRVAALYAEILSGTHEDPAQVLDVTFEAGHDEMVMVKDIPFYSVCEHHLVPMVGKAHVAYIPSEDGRITGLSKLVRLVQGYSRRLQVQERLTTQVADAVERRLRSRGVLVVVEAEHLCMTMRGVRTPGATAETSAVRGQFRDDARTRAEAMMLIHGR